MTWYSRFEIGQWRWGDGIEATVSSEISYSRLKCLEREMESSLFTASSCNLPLEKCTRWVHCPMIGVGSCTHYVHFSHWECHMSWLWFYTIGCAWWLSWECAVYVMSGRGSTTTTEEAEEEAGRCSGSFVSVALWDPNTEERFNYRSAEVPEFCDPKEIFQSGEELQIIFSSLWSSAFIVAVTHSKVNWMVCECSVIPVRH